ncbi:hypothetical protein ACTA71_008187 [Dictyostelium dimigraforme]
MSTKLISDPSTVDIETKNQFYSTLPKFIPVKEEKVNQIQMSQEKGVIQNTIMVAQEYSAVIKPNNNNRFNNNRLIIIDLTIIDPTMGLEIALLGLEGPTVFIKGGIISYSVKQSKNSDSQEKKDQFIVDYIEGFDFDIRLKEGTTVPRCYPVPLSMEQELKDQLTMRLKITLCQEEEWRMRIDNQSLNDAAVDDTLPNTKVLIQKIKGAKLMSKIEALFKTETILNDIQSKYDELLKQLQNQQQQQQNETQSQLNHIQRKYDELLKQLQNQQQQQQQQNETQNQLNDCQRKLDEFLKQSTSQEYVEKKR